MPDGYVTVGNFMLPLEAELARVKLDSENIPAIVLDENVTAINPIWCNAIGVRVQVPIEHFDRAKELLNPQYDENQKYDFEFPPAEPGEDYEELTDFSKHLDQYPKCGSDDFDFHEDISPIAKFFLMPIAGIFSFIPMVNRRYNWCCNQCDHVWRAP
jgi:hypothetical protein